MKLTDQEKDKIITLIKEDKPIPSFYKAKLFKSEDTEFIELTKDYKLIYKGKTRKEDIIANTPITPFQKVRSFNSDDKFEGGWSNMLIFGDNLLALKTLYDDQRGANIYKTKNHIKLIYIDPPFSTKQDFMKDREKAYRDKIIGSYFIEFLRKRLILLREILADSGSIYVHLDWKKGHYIKAVLDEVFGEHNYLNEIIWKYFGPTSTQDNYPRKHESIYFYAKNKGLHYFDDSACMTEYDPKAVRRYDKVDEEGRRFKYYYEKNGTIRKAYLKKGKPSEIFNIPFVQGTSGERLNYPTQKPEELIQRIIIGSSEKNDIILDAFSGSGTTLSVAEKLGRRWIGVDCGKLSIYFIQKRMLNLTTQIGSIDKDARREHERVEDFEEHSKGMSRGLFLIYEKARKGELIITDFFLRNLAEFVSDNLKGTSDELFSLICPEEKFKVTELEVIKNEENTAGQRIVKINRITFLISFIQPKEKTEIVKPLKSKEFTLYHAGIYDNQQILNMDWNHYKPFVMQLFGVREHDHQIHGLRVDGYIGVHSALVWNYPENKQLILDREYVNTLHNALGGKAGNKFYVIAPIVSMAFMEDEIVLDKTTYVFLKVPLSIIMALIEKGEPGSIKQPVTENDVNEVIDAVGFDFISQPLVKAKYCRTAPINQNLLNQGHRDYVIKISEFKSNTLVYDPEDFENFETLSMVLIDSNYNGEFFNLDKVFWSDQILNEEKSQATIRIPQEEFTGDKMMIIFMDRYGNELKVAKSKEDFK